MKMFVEARYLDVLSPALMGSANGLGRPAVAADTKMIPVYVRRALLKLSAERHNAPIFPQLKCGELQCGKIGCDIACCYQGFSSVGAPTSPRSIRSRNVRASLRSPGWLSPWIVHRSRNSSQSALRSPCWARRFCRATASSRRRAASGQSFSGSSKSTGSANRPWRPRAHSSRQASNCSLKARFSASTSVRDPWRRAGPYCAPPPTCFACSCLIWARSSACIAASISSGVWASRRPDR